jgi:phage gp36-like protein
MFISPEEMNTHLYAENIEIISRGDETVMTAAIDSAIAEMEGYLRAYDTDSIFLREGKNRNALLVMFAKDIAAWHFLVLCNAGHQLELRQDRYDRAISWLKAVQKGDVVPSLPSAEKDGVSGAGVIKFGSNTPRNNHF